MASSHAQILPNEEEPPYSAARFQLLARRTPSFSSSSPSNSWDSSFGSSSFSFNEEFPPFTPSTPPLNFKGVPFSWEQIPGIPKHHQSSKKKESSSGHLLPLPPASAGNSNPSTKKMNNSIQEVIYPKKYHTITSNRLKRDPFFAALVECSKDQDEDDGTNFGNTWKGSSKISRTLSDRFGFINTYTSCKRSCAISQSIVYLPKSSPHYNLLNPRST